jgi:hypothetical protein
VADAFVDSLARNFGSALHLLQAALEDTPDELWETDLWPDVPTRSRPEGGIDGSAPWFLGYHALTVTDYDLSGELEPWGPVPPFDEHVWSWPARVFTRAELLGGIEHCRGRVSSTLVSFADKASLPLPPAHRAHPTSYGVLVGSLPVHVTEHAAQIRQFLTTSGVTVQPVPGDRTYRPGA